MTRNLAVLGSPIAHSKSPQIQLAALSQLGEIASFERIEVKDLSEWLPTHGNQFDALSLTMPLKEQARALADSVDDLVLQTNSANYLLREKDSFRAFNTDVLGLSASAASHTFESVAILGTGASARSALVAFSDFKPFIWGRDTTKARALEEAYGCQLVSPKRALDADLVISTLPGNALFELASEKHPGLLFDIIYSRPSPAGFAGYIPGIHMLIWQAIGQLRLLLTGEDNPLPDEKSLFQLMLKAAELAE
jgi:shikimate dehydrogenase